MDLMDAWETLAIFILIALVIAAIAVLCGFAALGAVSGYVAGRRAPSSTGRSGAMAGLAIGAFVGVLAAVLIWLVGFEGGPSWAILLIGVLTVLVVPALFAYRRDLRKSTIRGLLAVGVAVVVVLGAIAMIVWLTGTLGDSGSPPSPSRADTVYPYSINQIQKHRSNGVRSNLVGVWRVG